MSRVAKQNSQVLSTGTIARLLHVCPRTVAKWIDSGKLAGYRLPGSGDRRVTKTAYNEFLEKEGLLKPGLPFATM